MRRRIANDFRSLQFAPNTATSDSTPRAASLSVTGVRQRNNASTLSGLLQEGGLHQHSQQRPSRTAFWETAPAPNKEHHAATPRHVKLKIFAWGFTAHSSRPCQSPRWHDSAAANSALPTQDAEVRLRPARLVLRCAWEQQTLPRNKLLETHGAGLYWWFQPRKVLRTSGGPNF